MVKSDTNPGGTPIEVFDGFRRALAANRAQFYLDVASGPFYGFNRDGAEVSQGTIQNWWRQGMIGSAKAHYDGIKAFSETDQTDDLKAITVPVPVLQGDDDQVVPYKNASLLQDKLLANSELKIYPELPAWDAYHACRYHKCRYPDVYSLIKTLIIHKTTGHHARFSLRQELSDHFRKKRLQEFDFYFIPLRACHGLTSDKLNFRYFLPCFFRNSAIFLAISAEISSSAFCVIASTFIFTSCGRLLFPVSNWF